MRSLFRSALATIALTAGFQAWGATTLTVTPTQDDVIATGVSNAFVNNNYGLAGAVSVSGSGAGKGAANAVITFDVSTITAGFNTQFGAGNWTISGVSLGLVGQAPGSNNLFNTSNVAGTFTIDWVPNDVWTEGTGSPNAPTTTGLTWANASLGTPENLGNQSYNGGTGAMSFGLTTSSGLLGDINSGGLVTLEMSAVSSTMTGVFVSRNNGTSANWPVLSITASAIPEPGRVGLMAVGALGLCLRRRRNSTL